MVEATTKKKLNIGFFSLTCDEGCFIMVTEFLNTYLLKRGDYFNIQYARQLRDNNKIEGLDVAFVEGVVSSERDKKEAEEIRKHSKRVVAMGNCAITGQPSAQRNFFSPELKERIKPQMEGFDYLEKALPVKQVIDADEEIVGCPIDQAGFVRVMEKYLKEFNIIKE